MSRIDTFSWVRIIRDDSKVEKLLLATALVLASYADSDGGGIRPGEKRLAEGIGVDVRTVRRHLQALRELGYICQEKRGHRSGDGHAFATLYQLTVPSVESDGVEGDLGASTGQSCPVHPVENPVHSAQSTGHPCPVEEISTGQNSVSTGQPCPTTNPITPTQLPPYPPNVQATPEPHSDEGEEDLKIKTPIPSTVQRFFREQRLPPDRWEQIWGIAMSDPQTRIPSSRIVQPGYFASLLDRDRAARESQLQNQPRCAVPGHELQAATCCRYCAGDHKAGEHQSAASTDCYLCRREGGGDGQTVGARSAA